MVTRILFRLAAVAVLLVFLTPNFSLSIQERRIALVIGNGSYKKAPLANPVNDANDMADTLQQLGFKVIHKINSSQRGIEDSIREFGKQLKRGDVGLFFFAGHGIQVNGRNYLIPIGAKIYEETDVKYEAVDAGQVLDAMYNAENMLNIVILDACRDNPFARSFRSGSTGLARMDAPKGTIIAYSTSPGKVAIDGTGRNSPYTWAFLNNIKVPGLAIEQVFKRTRRDIDVLTNGKQIPWESTSLTGDFFFVSKRGITVAGSPPTGLQTAVKEIQKYASISPDVSKPKEIGRDRHFIKYDTGVVKDTKTGLEWIVGPDRKTTWYEAKRWVENLNVAGGGWRMPTREELRSIYKMGLRHNMTPLLKTAGRWVWSEETKSSSSAWGFYFFNGSEFWVNRNYSYYGTGRGFAVRSQR